MAKALQFVVLAKQPEIYDLMAQTLHNFSASHTTNRNPPIVGFI